MHPLIGRHTMDPSTGNVVESAPDARGSMNSEPYLYPLLQQKIQFYHTSDQPNAPGSTHLYKSARQTTYRKSHQQIPRYVY